MDVHVENNNFHINKRGDHINKVAAFLTLDQCNRSQIFQDLMHADYNVEQ